MVMAALTKINAVADMGYARQVIGHRLSGYKGCSNHLLAAASGPDTVSRASG